MKKTILILAILTISILLFGCIQESPLEDEFSCGEITDFEECAKSSLCYPKRGPSYCSPDGKTCTDDDSFQKCVSVNEYCMVWTEEDCDGQIVPQIYETDLNDYFPEPVSCYWNSEISVCQTNIGY